MKTSINNNDSRVNRRQFLIATARTAAAAVVSGGYSHSSLANPVTRVSLAAAPGQVRLVPEPYNETNVWCYNGTVPGPEIRVTD